MKKLFLFSICHLLLLLMPVGAYTRYYVDGTNGNDTNTGESWGAAKKTIAAAAALGTGWDTIMVKGGTYSYSAAWSVPASRQYYGGYAGTETYAKSPRPMADVDNNGIIEPWEFSSPTISP